MPSAGRKGIMNTEFKYLNNPTSKDFSFQFDSLEYVVPAKTRKLMLAHVADHGEKRSYGLTDPELDEDGNVLNSGNDVYKRCYAEDANVENQIGYSEAIIVERSKDSAADAVSLSVDPSKPLGKRVRGRKMQQQVLQSEQSNDSNDENGAIAS